jgi:cephalosporin hydroxylase
MNFLNELAIKYGTDKQLACHGYIKHYYTHLNHLQHDKITMLEIGVHTGSSLMMWADYFKNGTIYGIDDGSSGDLRKEYPNHKNINFKEGSQIDCNFLDKLVDEVKEFDFIIDDGSHYSQDIVFTFKKLFKYIKPSGYYIIEDLHCSYPPYTVGNLAPRFNKENYTAVQFINDIANTIHIDNKSPFDSLFTYKGISFIKKL